MYVARLRRVIILYDAHVTQHRGLVLLLIKGH